MKTAKEIPAELRHHDGLPMGKILHNDHAEHIFPLRIVDVQAVVLSTMIIADILSVTINTEEMMKFILR